MAGYLVFEKRGGNSYAYVHHVEKVGRKVVRRKCYLGALRYRYVEYLNPLGLRGCFDTFRFLDYIVESLTQVSYAGLSAEELEEAKKYLDKVVERINELRSTVEKLVKVKKVNR